MPDLYIGKEFKAEDKSLGERFLLDSGDLTTHGIVIGMTGSGKTGLSIGIIEELLKAKVPVIVIDPKGDMGNLALAFDRLAPEQFEPWVDRDEAAREGKTVADVAQAASETWTKGLKDWGIEASDVAAYREGHRIRVFTPGATAGVPINLIDSLAAPGMDFEANEEELRDEIDSIVTALLGLVQIESDPVSSREYIYLFSLIEHAWRGNQDLNLETLISQVANPPIEKVGALGVDAFYPQRERNELMHALNNLVASPPFEVWRQGEPIDIESWVRTPDGKPQLSIVYTAHLEDEQRVFVTALILNKLKTWMRKQPGTSELRLLFYMDEIFGYFPPTANPPTKKPLLTLLKQARAYGVGILLSTQNPVDLDYKGLSNMGLWAIGRLQTEQDQDRVKQGIEAALADAASEVPFERLIGGVQKRVFLVHDIHRKAPELVHSRFVMSYLRGPITRAEIRALGPEVVATTATERPRASTGAAPIGAPEARPATAAPVGPPPLPAPLRAKYLDLRGGSMAEPWVVVRVAVRYKAGGVTTEEMQRTLGFRMPAGMSAGELLEQDGKELDGDHLSADAPVGLSYGDLPGFAAAQDGAKVIERMLRDRLDDRLQTELIYDPVTKKFAQPGEDEDSFAARLGTTATVSSRRSALDKKIAKLERDISMRSEELKGRRFEKWLSILTALLGNLNVFTGKSRRVKTTGMGSVLTKNRMENTAESRKASMEAQLGELKVQRDELDAPDTSRFERRVIKPAKTDVSIIRFDIAWVY
ncbi:MAG: helicase HerA-like domain-containing protein [Dehalococcoidia bacterium]